MAVITAVLFDWGGTLTRFHTVDLLEPWLAAARILAPERPDELARALLAAEDAVWARTRTSMRSARFEDVLRDAAAATGLPVDVAVHELAGAAYFDEWTPTTVARDDAVDTLQSLRARGLRTGLLSNTHWPRDQHERWLARDGLLDLLDVRVYTSDLAVVKPHPDAFGALLGQLGVEPRHAVFVGDRRHDDVYGAQQLGMRTVWVRNDAVPTWDVRADADIDELGELVAVVDRWRQAG